MKKILILLVVGILVLCVLRAGAFKYSGDENNHVKMTLSFKHLHIQNDGDHITLEIEGADLTFLKKDHYIIPTYIETFTFPFGTKIHSINVVPMEIHSQKLEKKLRVAPEPVLMDKIATKQKNNENVKPSVIDLWYNYDIGMGINRNERCVFVKVQPFPVQYHPEKNLIEWAEIFKIDIEYTNPPPQPQKLNDELYDLIVLTPGDYNAELSDLITHKINMGISTKLVPLFGIYNGMHFPVEGRDEPEQIKYFIKNAIEQWDTRYVLLVGGSEQFPIRKTHVFVDYNEGDDEEFVSDLYYADIYDENGDFCSWDSNENDAFGEYNWTSSHLYDDVDLYPDVYLGRLACVRESEVKTCVNKIITYETNEAYTQDWFTEMILCGGDTAPGDEGGIDEGEYICDIIEGIMDGFTATKLYATNGGINTARNMREKFNRGAGWLVLSGHANPISWSTHPHNNEHIWLPPLGFSNTDASRLTNGDKLPILFTDACSPFKFNVRDDCIGWLFVSNPNGGSIGGFGCTGLSWGSDGVSVIEHLTSKMMIDTFKAYKNKGAITIGEMWAIGISDYIYTEMDGGDHKSIEEWELFGDPTLAVAEESQAPLKPDVPEGSTSGSTNKEYTFTASTIEPDGDDVYYLFDWGDNSNSRWLGPYASGETCVANHTWMTQGSYQIKVKAKDEHGVQSEWSDPLVVSMPKNKAIYFNQLFYWFLEQHPRMFPMLGYLLGL